MSAPASEHVEHGDPSPYSDFEHRTDLRHEVQVLKDQIKRMGEQHKADTQQLRATLEHRDVYDRIDNNTDHPTNEPLNADETLARNTQQGELVNERLSRLEVNVENLVAERVFEGARRTVAEQSFAFQAMADSMQMQCPFHDGPCAMRATPEDCPNCKVRTAQRPFGRCGL